MDVFCDRGGPAARPTGCEADVARAPRVVPCRTLTRILEAARMPRVNFLSLDVEGFTPVALRSLDLGAVDVDVLLVESRDPADAAYLRSHGYATFALTQKNDGMRGFLADLLAWKPARFATACARLDRDRAALESAVAALGHRDDRWRDPAGTARLGHDPARG